MRRHLAALTIMALSGLCLGAHPVDAQEPSAVGLWQNIDPETGKPDGWFFISERNGTYEGAIVKMFLKPDDPPNPACAKCEGEQQDAPWLGLTIIKGMERKGLTYEHGTILDPRYGTEWNALMTSQSRRSRPDGARLSRHPDLRKNQYWKRCLTLAMRSSIPCMATRVQGRCPCQAGRAVAEGSKPPPLPLLPPPADAFTQEGGPCGRPGAHQSSPREGAIPVEASW